MAVAMAQVAERAKEQLAQVTGFRPAAVVGANRGEDGWHISVDVLELARIPHSTDLIGTYEVWLDDEGNLVKFEKKKARIRGETYQEDGS